MTVDSCQGRQWPCITTDKVLRLEFDLGEYDAYLEICTQLSTAVDVDEMTG